MSLIAKYYLLAGDIQAWFLFSFLVKCSPSSVCYACMGIGNTTVADWDSMDRVTTQTRGQAFQRLGRIFETAPISK